MLAGLFTLVIAVIGIFRFSHTMNRINAAMKCDAIGAVLVLLGLVVLSGWNMFSLKLAVSAVFMCLCSPAAMYLLARAEVKTNPELEAECDFVDEEKEEMPNDDD